MRNQPDVTRSVTSTLRRLTDIEGISAPSRLEFIEIDSCNGFRKIDRISSLTSLVYLCLLNIGEVDSHRPLLELSKLEAIFFFENTNVEDGDVACLKSLKSLKHISFKMGDITTASVKSSSSISIHTGAERSISLNDVPL